MPITRAACEALDRADPLAGFRSRFTLPGNNGIYLDGNSLGLMPKATPGRLAAVATEWGARQIGGWNGCGWLAAPQRVGELIGSVIGADPGTVLAQDSTSVQLYRALSMALRLNPERSVIVVETDDFSTDRYIAEALCRQRPGLELRRVPGDALAQAVDERTAVLVVGHVHYRTGRRQDLSALAEAAHARGALLLADLAHSAGVVDIRLGQTGTDFAVGCGYKFLNGGPGAPGFIAIHPRHLAAVENPIAGWLGHARPFAFEADYAPAEGILRAQSGTPPVFGLAALEEGVGISVEAGIAAIAAKAERLTGLALALAGQELAAHGFTPVTPAEPGARAGQVSLAHAEAWPINQALIAAGVTGDFRTPDVLRLGFAPLYVSAVDVFDAIARLRAMMETRAWDTPRVSGATWGGDLRGWVQPQVALCGLSNRGMVTVAYYGGGRTGYGTPPRR